MELTWRDGPPTGIVEGMQHMTIEYAEVLADCRSCLAALADSNPFEQSVAYERLLLDLDAIHGDIIPALERITGVRDQLLLRFETGIDRLIDLGGNGLSLELLLHRLP